MVDHEEQYTESIEQALPVFAKADTWNMWFSMEYPLHAPPTQVVCEGTEERISLLRLAEYMGIQPDYLGAVFLDSPDPKKRTVAKSYEECSKRRCNVFDIFSLALLAKIFGKKLVICRAVWEKPINCPDDIGGYTLYSYVTCGPDGSILEPKLEPISG